MTADDYAKAVLAALDEPDAFEWYRVVHPEALRALLEERKAMKRHILRALEAWDTTPLPASGDGMLQERMEDLRAHLTTTADNQEPPKGQ